MCQESNFCALRPILRATHPKLVDLAATTKLLVGKGGPEKRERSQEAGQP